MLSSNRVIRSCFALIILFPAVACTADRVLRPFVTENVLELGSTEIELEQLEDVDRGWASRGTQSVTGHGNIMQDGALRTFSFNAIRHPDQSVQGEWELTSRATGARLHGRVTCFYAFPRPNDPARGAAFLGGVVTQSESAQNFPVGTLVAFNAFDNGEGIHALFPDFISLVRAASPLFVERNCRIGLRIEPVLPIEGGNIQIRL